MKKEKKIIWVVIYNEYPSIKEIHFKDQDQAELFAKEKDTEAIKLIL
jgi:hypothetical protein